jgi:hypothetical protein
MNTTYFLNLVMGNIFRTQTSPAIPATYYVGLSTTTPVIAGTGVTEPLTARAYARQSLASKLTVPAAGVIKNSAQIDFPESTGDWGTITHYVVYDAATNGNLLFFGALTQARTIEAQTIISIKANELQLTLSNVAV